jgi:folate-binding protein YgfZ
MTTYLYPFPSQLPSSYADLPATLISLEDWSLISVDGADSRKYLQGQLTCDIDALTAPHYTQAAHCDPKGKLWSNLLLFPRGEGLAYIERASLQQQQLAELKKYAVFSKVSFTLADDCVLLGFAGLDARQTLSQVYPQLPDDQTPVDTQPDVTLLHIAQPNERFLLIATKAETERLFHLLLGKVALNNSQQWLALDIESGIPVIDLENSAQFLPQSVNLQALDAISFTKGCYSGQEMVARAKYRGANKRAMYALRGKCYRLPTIGEELELQLGEGWRRTGTVLASVKLTDESVLIQAVLNNDLGADAVLRVRDDENGELTVQPLPYSLNEEK